MSLMLLVSQPIPCLHHLGGINVLAHFMMEDEGIPYTAPLCDKKEQRLSREYRRCGLVWGRCSLSLVNTPRCVLRGGQVLGPHVTGMQSM